MRRNAILLGVLFLSACVPGPTPAAISPTPSTLAVEVLFPQPETEIEMGQALRLIVRLTTDGATAAPGARLIGVVFDPEGRQAGEIEAVGDEQGVYRTPAWIVPHRSLAGEWRLALSAEMPGARGAAPATFRVRPSTSEELLARYGFWIDAPSLRGIVPFLAGEFGDARNGRVLWGGVLPAGHILPAAWVEIQWRQGLRPLADEHDVLRFFEEDLGRYGFTAIRALGPITPTTFKDWPAWRVGGRGQFYFDQVEWIVFYAPEVDRTFALGTTVVLPPRGINAPAELLKSFEVFPEIPAAGVAPAPLPDLLPAPRLQGPGLGEAFVGEVPIVLAWDWLRPLAEDEVFLVSVDYNYVEANRLVTYLTRQSRLSLPASLLREPNCQVFNWRVSVVRDDGSPAPREAVSHESLYAYVLWSHASVQDRPFDLRCPNAQY